MLISVYITSYNQKGFLRQAIESVLAQTFKPFEIIVVDDCSTDGSRELIESYEIRYPGFIRSIFQTSNRGVTQCRIDAVKFSRGDYLTYLDGDDLYLPQKLEDEAYFIKKYNADLAFSNFCRIKEDAREITSIWLCNSTKLPPFGNMYYEVFLRQFPNNTLFRCELVKRDILNQSGLYDSNLRIYEDFELKIR